MKRMKFKTRRKRTPPYFSREPLSDLCLVEWPEKIEELLPDDAMNVRIRVDGSEQRTFFID